MFHDFPYGALNQLTRFVTGLPRAFGWSGPQGTATSVGGTVCGTVALADTVAGSFALADVVAATLALADTVSGTFSLEDC